MEVAGIVLHQVIIMFLLLLVGVVIVKKKIITTEASRNFCDFLLKIVVPCMIINSYNQPISQEKSLGLLVAFVLAGLFHFLAIFLSRILIRKDKENLYRIERLSVIYSNSGFMGFPILLALLGKEGTFYGTAFVAMFNIVIWIEGIKTLNGGAKIGLKKSILNPGCIAVVLGLFVYITQLPLPAPVAETIGHLGSMNTPLAMVLTGAFLAEVSPQEAIRDLRSMKAALLKTILIPLVFLGVLFLIGAPHWIAGGEKVAVTIFISASCPTAASIILIPVSQGMSGSQGAKILAISTLISIITLPIMSFLAYAVLM